jgi:hypothetical protein
MVGTLDSKGKLIELDITDTHGLHSVAKVQAESMARSYPGKCFVVLEAIDTVQKSDIAWEPCSVGLPF